MLSITEEASSEYQKISQKLGRNNTLYSDVFVTILLVCVGEKGNDAASKTPKTFSNSPMLQFALGVGITLATVGMGVYAF